MRVDKEFVLREIAGDYIIIPTGKTVLEFNGLITVNEVGVSIWNMLQKEVTFDKLVQGILDEYDVEEQVAREDIIWHRAALQPVNALVARQIQRCQSGVQYVLHQDQYPIVGYGHGSGIHSVRILSILTVDSYDHIRNDDIIPAAEK